MNNSNKNDDLNKDNAIWIAGIRHERKNVQPGSMADLFLAEVERWADPPRTLRERRTTPPIPDDRTTDADPPTVEGHTGPPGDSTG